MILGFLGKGGSGKSSVATQMALFLHTQGKTVLAIDADHNMDLSYNLCSGTLPAQSYIGAGLTDIKEYLGIPKEEKYDQYFLRDEIKSFTISDPDAVTQKYSIVLKPKLRLMTAGPQTEVVLHGQSCSHILTTPLKLYLPLLSLEGSEMVVVDEKAGADGVTTGIVTGIDVGVIVIEPALHSIKTALQIADLMKFYNTPFVFAGNKITNQFDKDFIVSRIGQTPVIYLPKSDWVAKEPGLLELTWQGHLNELYYQTALLNTQNRYERTREKFRRNLAFTK